MNDIASERSGPMLNPPHLGELICESMDDRDIDPCDKSWLRRKTRRTGVSMEELVRRLIHEKRMKAERRPKPSGAFARHFGECHGVELLPLIHRGYKPLPFSGMSAPLAWLIDAAIAAEVMWPRPEPPRSSLRVVRGSYRCPQGCPRIRDTLNPS